MQIYGTADLKMKDGRTAETSAGNAMRHFGTHERKHRAQLCVKQR